MPPVAVTASVGNICAPVNALRHFVIDSSQHRAADALPPAVLRSALDVRLPGFRSAPVAAPLLAASFGAALGLVTFLVTAWLWRHGAAHAASLTADSALLFALVCIAAFALLDGPARLRRARVPIGRAMPPAWWPHDSDTVPLLAACVGMPLVIGAGLAALLFR